MDTPEYVKEVMKDFDFFFVESSPGNSGPGGNDPQEPDEQFKGYPQEVRDWLKATLLKARRRLAREVLDIIQANESDLEKGYQEVAKKFSTE